MASRKAASRAVNVGEFDSTLCRHLRLHYMSRSHVCTIDRKAMYATAYRRCCMHYCVVRVVPLLHHATWLRNSDRRAESRDNSADLSVFSTPSRTRGFNQMIG